MAEVLTVIDSDGEETGNTRNKTRVGQDSDSSDSMPEATTKKKAATKRARRVVPVKSYEHIYTVSDNLFSFDQRRVPTQLIDSDEDDDGITWQGQLSPVKKMRTRAAPKEVFISSDEEHDRGDDDDVCIVGYKTPEKQNTSLTDKSPSPPPSPPSIGVSVQPTRSRRTNKVLRNVDAAMDSIRRSTFHSPLIRSPDDCFVLGASPAPEDKTMKVKIRCKLGVQRYDMKMTDQFGVIMKSLADKLNVDAERIILTLKDDSIVATDTPMSTNLQITDIIDCVVVDVSAVTSDPGDVAEDDDSYVHIKVQGCEKNKKVIAIKRTDPLEKLMDQYCAFKKIPRTNITFIFDGDKICPDNTPDDLDMETDDVIDVMIT